MNEKDYLNKATEKIFVASEKEKVKNELFDHIEMRKDFYKDIGYDDEAAEEKASEAMGDAEEISSVLGELHSIYYNPLGDIIFTLLWLALLGGGFFLSRKYLFGDPGVLSLLFGECVLALSLYFVSSFAVAKRKMIFKPLFQLIGAAGTGVFVYFIFSEINTLTYGNNDYFAKYLLNSYVNFTSVPKSNTIFYSVVSAVFIVTAVFAVSNFIYCLKRAIRANTRIDNKFNNFTVRISAVLSVVFIIATAGFCGKFFIDRQAYKEDFTRCVTMLQDIASSCHSKEDVLSYLDDRNIDYVTKYDASCVVETIFADCQIEFPSPSSDDDGLSLGLERTSRYYVVVSLPTNRYERKMDSITLSRFKTDSQTIDELNSFIPYQHSGREKLEFYSSYQPALCSYSYNQNDFSEGQYSFDFATGVSKTLFTYNYTFNIENEQYFDIKNKSKEIVKILKANINSSRKNIAKATNTTLEEPEISQDDWNGYINTFGTLFDRVKPILKAKYEELYIYRISDKWYFTLHVNSKGDRDRVNFYYDDLSLAVITESVDGNPVISTSLVNDVQNKLAFNGGYFDRYGRFYSSELLVKYYSQDGKSYTYYSVVDFDAENEDDYKKYYLVDNEGNLYRYSDCFIDSDGWLCINKTGKYKMQEENVYKDSNGKVYTKPFATNWDDKGNLISVEEQKEIIEQLEAESLIVL